MPEGEQKVTSCPQPVLTEQLVPRGAAAPSLASELWLFLRPPLLLPLTFLILKRRTSDRRPGRFLPTSGVQLAARDGPGSPRRLPGSPASVSPPLAEGTADVNPLFWGKTCYLFLVTCYHQKSGHSLTEGQVLMDGHDSELLMEETECLPYERMKEIASGEERMSPGHCGPAEGRGTMDGSCLGDVEFSWNHGLKNRRTGQLHGSAG